MSKTFDFSVNGKAVSVTLDNEETPLLNVLRNDLGLVGTRFGCGLVAGEDRVAHRPQ